MNKKEVVEISLKLLGIYFFASFILSIPYAILVFISDNSSLVKNEKLYLFLNSLVPIGYLLISVFLLNYWQLISNKVFPQEGENLSESEEKPNKNLILSIGVILIGIFYLVNSLSKLLGLLVNVFTMTPNIFWLGQLTIYIVMLTFSLIFVFNSAAVLEFIEKKSNNFI